MVRIVENNRNWLERLADPSPASHKKRSTMMRDLKSVSRAELLKAIGDLGRLTYNIQIEPRN
jgi:hypothetical protein